MSNGDGYTVATIPSSNLAPAPRADVEEARSTACIGKSVIIKGEVIGAEDLTIDGQVEGRIELRDHSLTIGVGAALKADVIARTVTVRGAVTGNIMASEILQLRETGSVDGNISAPRFAMSDGGMLSGRVETRPAPATAHGRP
jgi:cytoskeletal protein CcmA (bactofilin family)